MGYKYTFVKVGYKWGTLGYKYTFVKVGYKWGTLGNEEEEEEEEGEGSLSSSAWLSTLCVGFMSYQLLRQSL